MTKRPNFYPAQAQELAQAFNAEGVDYMFIGKSGAILLGYPGTTQDVDVFPARSPENGQRIVRALNQLGFTLDEVIEQQIIAGKDFIQIKSGPFDIDLIFAPDGIQDYAKAKARMHREGIFPIVNLRDLIASKRAANRMKDTLELPLLEEFRKEYEKLHPKPLRSATEIAMDSED
ncbi:MAG: hypothetical protein HY231_21520 [Acidobacteria bacterium]|nr:hypothetical protein [Acidobacteriota bacterium]